MAKVIQVVLTGCKSYADGRRKFKQNTPVTLRDANEIAKYKNNALFSIRTIEEDRVDIGISAQRINPGDPFKAAVNENTTRLPQRKKKTSKTLKTKTEE